MAEGRQLDVPRPVVEIASRLQDAGYETWAVGGAVRDALLGVARSDWDLATAARPDTVRRLFQPSYPLGIRFGTVGVRGSDGQVYEVTTFRKDIETDGRHAVVEYADTIDDDLARRDFTINAIAYHPLRREYRDPFAGREDLRRRLLRCVGDARVRFAEDYLRVLRGLRFAGRYGLEIEPDTWAALVDAASQLSRLSGERIHEELLKVASGPNTAAALSLYRESGALAAILPELKPGDAEWAEIVRTIEAISPRRPLLRLVPLLAPLDGRLEEAMARLRFSNVELGAAKELAAGFALPPPAVGDRVAARRWVRAVGPGRVRDVLRLRFARARGMGAAPEERAELAARACGVLGVLRRGEPVSLGDLAIDGNDLKGLGLEPGPRFAEILSECLDAVIEDPERNRRETLLAMVRERGGP